MQNFLLPFLLVLVKRHLELGIFLNLELLRFQNRSTEYIYFICTMYHSPGYESTTPCNHSISASKFRNMRTKWIKIKKNQLRFRSSFCSQISVGHIKEAIKYFFLHFFGFWNYVNKAHVDPLLYSTASSTKVSFNKIYIVLWHNK